MSGNVLKVPNCNQEKMKKLFCGIGKSDIQKDQILITDYPLEPSIVYPKNQITAHEIDSICIEFGPCKIHCKGDIIFVSAEKKEALKEFAEANKIELSQHSWNWDWILEPYLDTEFTEENNKRVIDRLHENGVEKIEVEEIRSEVGKQMYKYNFSTMLWEWTSLGLNDVLSAMRAKYNTQKFRTFYKKALEIDQRKRNLSTDNKFLP